MPNYYSTVTEVKLFTGISKESFDIETKEEFEQLLEKWLIQAKAYIDRYTEINFTEEYTTIPPEIEDIATRIVANKIKQMQDRYKNPNASLEDNSSNFISDSVFSSAVKKDLDMFKKEPTTTISIRVIGSRKDGKK
ncbi:hypothetical protein [Virgibacillus sp. SK37]|uniref:hypothetical protein n=1 Tax=Virgibacillus sp. SK37 TaxID=403957 RepID=UPI0004D1FA30|nr:hypothetical protein [Virgibacillus sp. SK37]AIF45647.1 hypothetical protein X953_18825 [Virgibacillus sp. SK37]